MRLTIDTMNEHLDNQSEAQNRTYATQFFFRKGETTKNVKILLNAISEVPAFRTHTITRISKKGKPYFQEVGCLGDNCPFCRKAHETEGKGNVSFAHDRIVIPLVDMDYTNNEGQKVPTVAYWVRSSNFYRNNLAFYTSKFAGLLDGYIEVDKTGSGTSTNYTLFPANTQNLSELKSNDTYIKDFEVDIEKDLKSIIIDWTADQMEKFLGNNTNVEVPFYDSKEQPPVQRRVATHGF